MTRTVHCIKLDKDAEGLDFPPYPGELGKKIYENVSKEAWQAWIRLQTMLVNEYRLNMADPKRVPISRNRWKIISLARGPIRRKGIFLKRNRKFVLAVEKVSYYLKMT